MTKGDIFISNDFLSLHSFIRFSKEYSNFYRVGSIILIDGSLG